MKRYRFIEHTADIGLVAEGNNLAEAFANAAYGMFSIIADLKPVREVKSRLIELEGKDMEALLFDWLNTLLYLFDTDALLLKRFVISELSENRLKATCHGERYDPSRHRLKMGVKSATYHMLEVDREMNRVQLILDI
ncbi:MAG TPA: archease [Dehalococcoidia bacterium]|nr:archease [Dehalococcoidia bacterium]